MHKIPKSKAIVSVTIHMFPIEMNGKSFTVMTDFQIPLNRMLMQYCHNESARWLHGCGNGDHQTRKKFA